MEASVLVKRKRKVLLDAAGASDSEDPALLARRWAESLAPGDESFDKRSSSGNNICEAVWYPRHRVAVLTTVRGKMVGTFGETGVGGQALLLPEEALFLAERGYLTLFYGGRSTELAAFSDVFSLVVPGGQGSSSSVGSAAARHLPRLVSTAELYRCLTEAAGVPLLAYLAYRHLRDKELVVRRPLALVVGAEAAAAAEAAATLAAATAGASGVAGAPRRVSPRRALPAVLLTSPSCVAVAFEAWPWTAAFSKARCGAPTLRVAVARATDAAPSLVALSLAASRRIDPQALPPFRAAHIASSSEGGQQQPQSELSAPELPAFMVATVDDEGVVHTVRVSAERTSRAIRKQRGPARPNNT
jgi:hypothetical protein